MKKRTLFYLIFCGIIVSSIDTYSKTNITLNKSAVSDSLKVESKPQTFITLNSGINNYTGMLGIGAAYKKDNYVGRLGIGAGNWGGKYSFGFGYKAFRLSYSSASGGKNVPVQLTSTSGVKQEVKLDFDPCSLLDLSVEKLGNYGNFCYRFEIGYALRISGASWKVTNGVKIDQTSTDVINFMKPGGIILGIGFGVKID